MICASCGTENKAGRRFCVECGTQLAPQVCSSCGNPIEPGEKFCGSCGTPVSLANPSQAVASPVAERRLVSILFADLVGFTPFAEERDAEEVRDTLTRYFELASDVIRRYGGTVEKFIGDAVMAVWGAPIAHEDDAERAVRAALDLVDAVRTLGPEVQARAGVLTGEAAVTLGATNQGMVAGDLVNTASRLQAVAPPGSVLVGEATQRAASRAIAFEEAGEQTLKGKAAPIPAWRALRLVAEIGGKNRSEGLEAPFVGRDDELRLLKDLFLATGREKRIRLVSVIGPAGIGKSRLSWEFLKYVDGLVEDTYWHSGRSPAYGEGITFWALGEMVRERCGLVETDDEATTRTKVAASVREWVTDEGEREWIEPALLSLLGVESGAASDQLFAAWRTFFERIAALAPVVMVFEDLHFADSGTLDFIDHLLEWSKGLPIMVVTLARPELLDKRTDWGAGKRSFTSLYLEPLSETAMRELLSGLISGLPDAAATAIVNRADGIPLYAVETVRMLLAEGRLREEGGAYVPLGDLNQLAVPETLTALVASRLDGLEPADRTLVHDAAVLGQSFTLAGLAAVSGMEIAALEDRVSGLVRRELLTRQADARSPEKGQFAFVQAVIREVAYNTLARVDRKTRHLAAARYFESLGSDELAGALAGHYLSAHANAAPGAEAEALAGQARIALKAAAERAGALGAHDQAINFLEQALTVATDAQEQGEILERASGEALAGARFKAGQAFAHSAVERYRVTGDRLDQVRATQALGSAFLWGQEADEAIRLLDAASAEFADLWPEPEVVGITGMLAGAYTLLNRPEKAMAIIEPVLEIAEHRDLTEVLVEALYIKGAALAALGRVREGSGVIQAGENLARQAGLVALELRGILSRTFWQLETDTVAALAGLRQGMELARRVGDRRGIVRLANNIGFTEFQLGNWETGLATLEGALGDDPDPSVRVNLGGNALVIRAMRGEDLADELAELRRLVGDPPNPSQEVQLLDSLGHQAFAQGHWSDASRHWRRSAALDSGIAAGAHYFAARAALWAGETEGAREDVAAIDALGIHGRVVDNRRATIRAGLAAGEGHTAEALAGYREAIRTWHDLQLGNDEHFTAMDMAILLGPGVAEVGPYAAAAREFLVQVGAAPFVTRLDAAMGTSAASPAGSTNPVAVEDPALSPS